jgi:hypothetical protein
VKGIDESFNYLVNGNGFYDFKYAFPLTIMKDQYFDKSNSQLGMNEAKISTNRCRYLGVAPGHMNYITMSYSLQDLVYQ